MFCVLFSVPVCIDNFVFFCFCFVAEKRKRVLGKEEKGKFRPLWKREFLSLVGKGSFRPLGRIFNASSGSRALPLFFWRFLSPLFYGNAGAGYGFYTFTTESANQSPYVPPFAGKASSFLDYEQRATLWERSTEIPSDRRSTFC